MTSHHTPSIVLHTEIIADVVTLGWTTDAPDASGWDRHGAAPDASGWDSYTRSDGSGWDASGWDASGWDRHELPDASGWDHYTRSDASGWDASGWDRHTLSDGSGWDASGWDTLESDLFPAAA
jgi:hypothetical protein